MNSNRRSALGVLGALLILTGSPSRADEVDVQFELSEASPLPPGETRNDDGVSAELDFTGTTIPLDSQGQPLIALLNVPTSWEWQFTKFTYVIPDLPSSGLKSAMLDLSVDSFPAGGNMVIEVGDGSGNSGGPALGVEHSDHFAIDTGVASFDIPKNGSVLGDARFGSLQILEGGADSGFYVVGDDGVTYRSVGGVSQAIMKRNGPACTCIEIAGTMQDLSGNGYAEYTMTLTAYADQRHLNGSITLMPLEGSGGSSLHVQEAHVIFYALNDPAHALDDSTRRRAILTNSCYDVSVPNVPNSGPAVLPWPQSVGVERATEVAGFTTVTRWPAQSWPQILEPSGTSWISIQLWPRELAMTQSGNQWSLDPPGRFVEFTVGVHDAVPQDLEGWGHRRLSPLLIEQID